MAGAQHDLIEVMLGHKNGIRGVYFKPERDELFQEFKKFAADLTADPAERHRFEIEKKQKKIDILESGRVEVEDMSRAMDNMIKRIGFLEKARRVSDDEITEEDRMILNMYKKKVKEKISA